jgi:hypothetical protein
MRVTIEHTTEKISLFGKTAPAIRLQVGFTDTEKAVINKSGLTNYLFYAAPTHHGTNEVHDRYEGKFQTFRNNSFLELAMKGTKKTQGAGRVIDILAEPVTFYYVDLATARVEEEKIRTGLKTLKRVIDENTPALKTSDTFEL